MKTSEAFAELGLSPGASPDAIKAAFRQKAKSLHPDRNPDNPAAAGAFLRLKRAYDVLTGKEKPTTPAEVDGGRWTPPRPQRGADIHTAVTISLAEAARGGRAEVAVAGGSDCPSCGGSGKAAVTETLTCGACGGLGYHERARGLFRVKTMCQDCQGEGMVEHGACATCEGGGRNPNVGAVSVDYPPGVDDGTLIVLAGRGAPGASGGHAGDLKVSVRVAPTPRFRRRGADLVTPLTLSFADVCLGCAATVETLEGARVGVTVPPGTPHGTEIAAGAHGMPDGQGGNGQLLARVQIAVPKKLTPEQTKLLGRWKDLERGQVDRG